MKSVKPSLTVISAVILSITLAACTKIDPATEGLTQAQKRDLSYAKIVMRETVEVCHKGIVYLMYSPSGRTGWTTPLIDPKDRLPKTCNENQAPTK